MFDISEIEGKIILKRLENKIKMVTNIESGKEIYAKNIRTKEHCKLTFTKVNGSSYKVLLKTDYDETEKEFKLLTSGKLCVMIFKYTFTLYIRDDKLYIVAANEFEFYE